MVRIFLWMGMMLLVLTDLSAAVPESRYPLEVRSPQGHVRWQGIVELAQTPDQIRQGLMFRHSLPAKEGMFFILPTPRHQLFWMKNMRIPLDMLFIDAAGKVITIHQQVPPCMTEAPRCPRYPSLGVVKGVLEVKAGTVTNLGIMPGDYIQYTPLWSDRSYLADANPSKQVNEPSVALDPIIAVRTPRSKEAFFKPGQGKAFSPPPAQAKELEIERVEDLPLAAQSPAPIRIMIQPSDPIRATNPIWSTPRIRFKSVPDAKVRQLRRQVKAVPSPRRTLPLYGQGKKPPLLAPRHINLPPEGNWETWDFFYPTMPALPFEIL
ncbi:DUF192 domain-containing protein [Magnetococcus sp. PR-3]|uniref:DUF192 domain-containing protein n=1 Tax=Magnetococcus sp. PR-3 TaxID=3120355 RepID=UPI002FCE2BE7